MRLEAQDSCSKCGGLTVYDPMLQGASCPKCEESAPAEVPPDALRLRPGPFRDGAQAIAEEVKSLPDYVQAVEVTAHGSGFRPDALRERVARRLFEKFETDYAWDECQDTYGRDADELIAMVLPAEGPATVREPEQKEPLDPCPECHMTGPHKLQCSRRRGPEAQGDVRRAVDVLVQNAARRLREYLANGPSPEVNAENLIHLETLFAALQPRGPKEGET